MPRQGGGGGALTPSSNRPANGGFALVVALSLMAFVLLLLLSITTLVRVVTSTPAGVVKPLPHELKKNHRGQSKSLVIKEFTGYLYIYY